VTVIGDGKKEKQKSKNITVVGFGEGIILFDGGAILFYNLSLAELF
jgi:hypothetical protein